jgi:hypothetical protein
MLLRLGEQDQHRSNWQRPKNPSHSSQHDLVEELLFLFAPFAPFDPLVEELLNVVPHRSLSSSACQTIASHKGLGIVLGVGTGVASLDLDLLDLDLLDTDVAGP